MAEDSKITVREDYLDVAKAIGIFLVILGHCRMLPSELIQWIYAVHMPFFFICSGITYKLDLHKSRGFLNKRFLLDKFKRLYIPFILWAVIYSPLTLRNLILNLYASHTTLSMSSSLTTLWFLVCMFVATILFECVCMISSKTKFCYIAEAVVCFIAFVIGGMLLPSIKYGYPLCINIALVAILFMATGHLLFQMFLGWLKDKKLGIVGLIAIVTILISIIMVPLNLPFVKGYNVEMATGNYGNPWLFYFTSILGTVFILCVSLLISNNFSKRLVKVLANVGENTLGIMVLHKPIIQMIAKVVNSIPMLSSLAVGIIGVIASIAVCWLCYIITNIFRKYFPAVIGELG